MGRGLYIYITILELNSPKYTLVVIVINEQRISIAQYCTILHNRAEQCLADLSCRMKSTW